jgi:hypothetical protein
MTEKKCEVPTCKARLVKMEHESTWTIERYYCSNPKCGRVYNIATTTGKVAQLGGLASLGLLALGILRLDPEAVLQHGGEVIDHVLS